MLSDPDSEVIRSYGILNTLVPEDDHPWFGMPFPGVYVTNSDGVITSKFFENHLALRPTVEQLARAVQGDHTVAGELGAATPVDEVAVQVQVDERPIARGMQRDLQVTFRIPPGQHLYDAPVPEGLVATTVEFDEGIVALDPVAPATTELTLPTGETLQVFEGASAGVMRYYAPFTVAGGMVLDDGMPVAVVSGVVRWQACDDQACGLPQEQRFSFELPLSAPVVPHFREVGEGQMDFAKHFARMSERRSDA